MGAALTIAENKRHVGLRDAESFGYLGLSGSALQGSDLGYLFGAKKFFEEGNAADVDCVLPVHSVIDPFKIGHDAVRFDPINVVDHREIFGIGNEGEGNEAVQKEHLQSPIIPQAALLVTELVDAGLEYFAIAPLRSINAHASSIDASHSGHVTDFVKLTELGDGDTPPFFVVHDMGPFARSAHVIAPFCAHQGV
jgi:hypothetical protein